MASGPQVVSKEEVELGDPIHKNYTELYTQPVMMELVPHMKQNHSLVSRMPEREPNHV